MLGRRHFRAKVLQGLYAFFQGGEPRLEQAEKNLLQSIDRITELYFLQISFFLEVVNFYVRRMEDAKHKYYPTYEELNPNPKLLANLLVEKLSGNEDYLTRIRDYKISWTEEQDNVRKVFQRIRESKEHRDYLYSGENSFREDQEFVVRIMKKYILRSPELQFFCEERSIHWVDDFDVAAAFVLKTIRLLSPDFPSTTPLTSVFVRDPEEDPKEEHRFILDLFRMTVIHSEEFEQLIKGRLKNWELDRIALTDIIIIKMALAELLFFPTIPIKVTLNEYIELTKHFSTVKSKLFINGILDKLVSDLAEEDRIKKSGRGLIN
ncbi:MAG: transcription antitermination factor NusB [Bacteroidetes bacterium]|nr:MAG: transcription antitermination factor NusB [Bacteroidota bacterium]